MTHSEKLAEIRQRMADLGDDARLRPAELRWLVELASATLSLVDEVAIASTHPDLDGPGCWWCGVESGHKHKPGCRYRAALAAMEGGE